MAAFCRERKLWFHVDGAYGAFASGLPGAPSELKGLASADSVAVDPHKWLYAPLEAGCAVVRNPSALRNAFSYHPPYYSFEGEGMNYYDIGPQNSRGFRALKVWLALQQAGAAGYREMIQDDITLARHLYDLAVNHPELEAITHHLSITTLRYVPAELRANPASEHREFPGFRRRHRGDAATGCASRPSGSCRAQEFDCPGERASREEPRTAHHV